MTRTYRVRCQTSSGTTGWYDCTKVEYRDAALVLTGVTTGRFLDERLTADANRDIVIPWHYIRGPVEVIAVDTPTA